MSQSIQCNCGAVEIALDDAPLDQFFCHCRDCRASSGGAYSLAAVYSASEVRVVGGTLATSVIRTMARHHCAACGTQMTAEPGPDMVGVKADRLPPGSFAPAFHIHCASALLPVVDNLPHYADLPADWGGSGERVNWKETAR
jgi:hypothetical protein